MHVVVDCHPNSRHLVSTDESMIHLLHHQVKAPGQRVAPTAAEGVHRWSRRGPRRRALPRKTLRANRKRWGEQRSARRRILIHLVQYAVVNLT